jgi:hypothetical protein
MQTSSILNIGKDMLKHTKVAKTGLQQTKGHCSLSLLEQGYTPTLLVDFELLEWSTHMYLYRFNTLRNPHQHCYFLCIQGPFSLEASMTISLAFLLTAFR